MLLHLLFGLSSVPTAQAAEDVVDDDRNIRTCPAEVDHPRVELRPPDEYLAADAVVGQGAHRVVQAGPVPLSEGTGKLQRPQYQEAPRPRGVLTMTR